MGLQDLILAVPDENHHATFRGYFVELPMGPLSGALRKPIDILLCRHCRDFPANHITLDYRAFSGVFLPSPHDRWPVFRYQFCVVRSHCIILTQRTDNRLGCLVAKPAFIGWLANFNQKSFLAIRIPANTVGLIQLPSRILLPLVLLQNKAMVVCYSYKRWRIMLTFRLPERFIDHHIEMLIIHHIVMWTYRHTVK